MRLAWSRRFNLIGDGSSHTDTRGGSGGSGRGFSTITSDRDAGGRRRSSSPLLAAFLYSLHRRESVRARGERAVSRRGERARR